MIQVVAEQKDEDFWLKDNFEEYVVRGLLSQMETRVKKNKGAFPSDRMDLAKWRSLLLLDKPYTPGSNRVIIGPDDDGRYFVDLKTDGFPTHGCLFFNADQTPKVKKESPLAYSFMSFFRQIEHPERLSKHWTRFSEPKLVKLYELWVVNCRSDSRVEGERKVIGISAEGEVVPLFQRGWSKTPFGAQIPVTPTHEELEQNAANAAFAFGHQQDRCREKPAGGISWPHRARPVWTSLGAHRVLDPGACRRVESEKRSSGTSPARAGIDRNRFDGAHQGAPSRY